MRPLVRPRLLCARSKQIFSVKDGAAYLGLAESTLRRRISTGRLRAYPWDRRHVLLRRDLDHYRAELRRAPIPGHARSPGTCVSPS